MAGGDVRGWWRPGPRAMKPGERLLAILASLCLIAALAACSARSQGQAAVCESERPFETGKSHLTLSVGEAKREFLLYVPSGYDGSRPNALMLFSMEPVPQQMIDPGRSSSSTRSGTRRPSLCQRTW